MAQYAIDLKHIDGILQDIRAEIISACAKHPPMASGHEGKAVIEEELDELWDEIKANKAYSPDARKEAIQTAAMAARYIYDLFPRES